MKIINKPYIVFWITTFFILLDGFLIQDAESVVDINIHDSYYVIAHGFLAQIVALIFFVLGLGYWIFEKINRDLNQTLSIIHIVGTVVVTWIYRIVLAGTSVLKIENLEFVKNNSLDIAVFLIVFLVQPIYVVNIFVAILKPKASR